MIVTDLGVRFGRTNRGESPIRETFPSDARITPGTSPFGTQLKAGDV